MTKGRLSRQELGWLLAQEARGAAKALRQDVTLLTQPPPPGEAPTLPDVHLETRLNALDDAIGLLSQLESGPQQQSTKARRGRIDLAALLYEVAPNAKIGIEPGAGTEVFGDEVELRRLVQILVSQTNSPVGNESAGTEIQIRREGDWIRIVVDLGPDMSPAGELERRWLSRMAMRLGGRLELQSGTESVLLPADASTDQSEVADLRKELQQAQELGEAYARELAAAFGAHDAPSEPRSEDAADGSKGRFELLVSLASGLSAALRPLFRGLKEDSVSAAAALHAGNLATSLDGHLSAGYEIVGELGRVASYPLDEAPRAIDVAKVVREVEDEASGRAARHDVALHVQADSAVAATTRPQGLKLLLRALVDHAIAATPRGGSVRISVSETPENVSIRIEDGGPVVVPRARHDLVSHRVDASSLGRPPGIALTVSSTLAAYLGGSLQLGESENGACMVTATLPKNG